MSEKYTRTTKGSFSSPSSVILMAAGEILHRSDDATIDFDSSAVEELDNMIQDLAHIARELAEKARKVKRINIYEG